MSAINPRLPLLDDFDLKGKVVLARVDHNVVEKGVIKDSFRIDSTYGLIHYIAAKGGYPILMTHVGRTRDKKTGFIKTGLGTAVEPVVGYLNRKIRGGFVIPELSIHPDLGIESLPLEKVAPLLTQLKNREIGGIYLPNTRWFAGEESKDEKTKKLANELAALADLYVNDAFGSWQAHASTYDIAANIPSTAGFLMEKELVHLDLVLNPTPPFLAVVAGSKYDTKIGPLNKLYDQVEYLLLGGVIYNAFLSAKYGITVAGVDPADVELARGLVEKDKNAGKILEPKILIESQVLDRRDSAQVKVVPTADFKEGQKYAYFLDIAPESFDEPKIKNALANAKTIFVNAVMGLTPHFPDGSARLYSEIAKNTGAKKLFGGGDTLTELKNLTPGVYLSALDDESYYFFTGGGAVLTAIESGAYGLKPVAALLKPEN
ncbi:MAG: phosphoglycerate kinase [Deltaproteobacteria bacterium]|jgi:phosphoglycerate kinase|nr:phosphoglycerate kinase [Deltaproteobacteria bacterium]